MSEDTINVARGESHREAKRRCQTLTKEILPSLCSHEKERVKQYLDRHDVTNTSKFKNLQDLPWTPHQQRALQRRQGDKKQRDRTQRLEVKRIEAAIDVAAASSVLDTHQAGCIEAESEMEATHRLTQQELKAKYLDENTARHIFDLTLPHYGPYGMTYDLSGRYSILFGRTGGHVAMMDNHDQSLECEMHLNEPVRDATTLHNHTLFAVAQKKHVYIYDNKGCEIHFMDSHHDPFQVQFLPHHWLLASVGRSGWLKYHDTSTGLKVSEHRTKLGPCHVMRQNPQTAMLHLGHTGGTVSLWSPASSEFVMKLLCHRGAVFSVAVDATGHYMVTSGADKKVKVWDLRTYKEMYSFYTVNHAPASTVDISQRGILGVGHGHMTTFWNNPFRSTRPEHPYMIHKLCGKAVETLRFRPFEDVCGIGHNDGISSIVIPGSGEPNLDSMEASANPFADNKQHRENVVRSLLDKLAPDTISLEPNLIGAIQRTNKDERREKQDIMAEADEANTSGKVGKKEKNKARGKNKIGRQLGRKRKNIVDESVLKLREAKEKEQEENKRKVATEKGETYLTEKEKKKAEAPAALKRFFD